ncbi:MAG: DUF6351 family protein [Solirubrobacterales bacterium]
MRRMLFAALVAAAMMALAAPAAHGAQPNVKLKVLSGAPNQVSGGDALVSVIPKKAGVALHTLRVQRNGMDVTNAFEEQDGILVGLVDRLRLRRNVLTVTQGNSTKVLARLTIHNYPTEGPIFSGPHQEFFVCNTIQAGLGEPLVDNQDGQGFRVQNPDGSTAGWSLDCSANTRVDYLYRTTGGSFQPLPSDGSRPSNMAQTTLLDGSTVDYVVRRERGTIDRFIYSFAMLAPFGEDPGAEPDTSLWNRRLIFTFDGGVQIGHRQGSPGGSALYDTGLSKGYAIVHSSGTRTSTHYNLQLGGETALMTKEEFIERYGVPLYTVAVGGSGGAIQQYVYGQNHGRLLDAGIPQYSYSDMVTQTIHVGDCELLERYMDVDDGSNPKWQNWDNREWLEGLNADATIPNVYRGGAAGNSECVRGWRGLTPLALNPLWFQNFSGLDRMDPAEIVKQHWTHWEDLRNIYGVGDDGYALMTYDNVGVQYGLKALTDGNITPAEFLDVNARVGSWKDPKDMVQEAFPFPSPPPPMPPARPGFDPWSAGNMNLSPDGGATPAPRREGDIAAMNAAYNEGLYFDGDIDIPLIDWRHYLEEELDMHHSHQSFATRQRMLDRDGNADNQVIWFTDARPSRQSDATPEAFEVIDEWMANIRENPDDGVAGNKPELATDRCFTTAGAEIARGSDVWDGILDSGPQGACAQEFPLHSTSRIVSGGPLRGGVYKCGLQSVEDAIAGGVYGSWTPSPAEVARLKEIFPTGVCDYGQEDAGRP